VQPGGELTGYLNKVFDAFHSPEDTGLVAYHAGHPEHFTVHELQEKTNPDAIS